MITPPPAFDKHVSARLSSGVSHAKKIACFTYMYVIGRICVSSAFSDGTPWYGVCRHVSEQSIGA